MLYLIESPVESYISSVLGLNVMNLNVAWNGKEVCVCVCVCVCLCDVYRMCKQMLTGMDTDIQNPTYY